jgi:hypothetical protein
MGFEKFIGIIIDYGKYQGWFAYGTILSFIKAALFFGIILLIYNILMTKVMRAEGFSLSGVSRKSLFANIMWGFAAGFGIAGVLCVIVKKLERVIFPSWKLRRSMKDYYIVDFDKWDGSIRGLLDTSTISGAMFILGVIGIFIGAYFIWRKKTPKWWIPLGVWSLLGLYVTYFIVLEIKLI